MRKYSLTHLSDAALTRDLSLVVGRENSATAEVLAHIAEFDRRKLHRRAGYQSMYKYCLGALHLSEHGAYKRIVAARAARPYPAIFQAVADGQVHLSGLLLLAPHLTPANAASLLLAATHKSKAEIEHLLAERFPKPDVPTRVVPVSPTHELAPGLVDTCNSLQFNAPVAGSEAAEAPRPEPTLPRPQLKPLSPQRFEWHLTVDQATQDLATEAKELLSHHHPNHELPKILHDALEAYVCGLRKAKHAQTDSPKPRKSRSWNNPRYIPNAVKQAVWKRDGGRCTFVSESGHRCDSREQIEYDHIEPVARGGTATVRNTRLLCHAHNQFEAERAFGESFMRYKRESAAQ